MKTSKKKSISEKILYTLHGCPACIKIKKELEKEILEGKIEIKECNPNSKDKKKLEACLEAIDRDGFDGFPSMYNRDGEKEI